MNYNILLPNHPVDSCCNRDDEIVNANDKFVKNDVLYPLSQIVGSAGSGDSGTSAVGNDKIRDSFLYQQLWRNICSLYGYNIDFEAISEIYKDNFFQLHALNNGYKFTACFLSIIDKNWKKFIGEIDSILENSFPFFYGIRKEYTNFSKSMKEIFLDFSKSIYCKYACHLKPKFINFLQHNSIPLIVGNIINCNIIDAEGERKMTHLEMEEFFLHYITTSVSVIISRIINYWDCFLDKSMSISSLLPYIDHISNFDICIYNDSFSNVVFSAAFICKFGVCISFVANTKIDIMKSDFIRKCSSELKRIVNSRCTNIYNCSSNVVADVKKIKYELRDLVRKEFFKNVRDEIWRDKFSSFLREVVIWNQHKIESKIIKKNRLLLFNGIINSMFKLLLNTATKDTQVTISDFCSRIRKYISIISTNVLPGSDYLLDIESKLKVKLHPSDRYSILAIRSKFSSKSKEIIRDNFSKMLKERYKFKDNTVVDTVPWSEISENLYPIAQELVSHVVKHECEELHKIFSNARIVENIFIFDGSYLGTREATSEEKRMLLDLTTSNLDLQNRNSFRAVWENLTNISGIENSEDVGFVGESIVTSECKRYDIDASSSLVSPIVDEGDLLVANSSLQGESLPVSSDSSVDTNCNSFIINRDKAIDKWGLYVYPRDDEIILFVMKKFSVKIRSILSRLFFYMIESSAVFPVIFCRNNDYSCRIIPSGLYKIAKESVEKIIKDDYLELDRALSKVHVINVDVDRYSLHDLQHVIRDINDDEKDFLTNRVKLLIEKDLEDSINETWLEVSSTENVVDMIHNCEDHFADISEFYCVNDYKIRLRYEDHTAILSVRRKFASEVCSTIYNKFYGMLKDSHRFDDDIVITKSSWKRISKKLLPIARNEINPLLDREHDALQDALRVAKVSVDSEVYRELTNEEECTVLENIMKLVHKESKSLFKGIWEDVIFLFGDRCKFNEDYYFAVNLFYEDHNAIFSIRRRFSSKMRIIVHNKFCEMLVGNYKFDDGTAIDRSPWRVISKKLLPIAKREISPIIKAERIKISEVLLKSRVVISGSDSFSSDTREITYEERLSALENIMEFVYRQAIDMISKVWRNIIKFSTENILEGVKNSGANANSVPVLMKSAVNSLSVGLDISESDAGDAVIIRDLKLRCCDNLSILNTRRMFSSEMRFCIRNKFYTMLKGNYRFDDDTVISRVSWSKISKKLLPIAENEIKSIMDRERIKITDILLKSRVVVSSPDGFYSVNRDLTQNERFYALEKIMKSVHKQAVCMFSRAWGNAIKLTHEKYSESDLNCDVSNNSVSKIAKSGELGNAAEDFLGVSFLSLSTWGINIRYRDWVAILNERKKFSRAMKVCIRDKFCEMLRKRYKFDDRTVIDRSSWRKLSKKLIPIAQKEVEPIIKGECAVLRGILLKSRVVLSDIHDCYYYDNRDLTDGERSNILEKIMKSVYKQAIDMFGRVWGSIIKYPEDEYSEEYISSIPVLDDFTRSGVVKSVDLRREDREEFDNIRLEFVGILGPIIGEILGSLLISTDMSSSQLMSVLDNVNLTIYKKSHILFKEEGFFSRVELLLSTARVVELPGNDRSLTDSERNFVFQLFMYNIDSDRDYLVKKRVEELRRSVFTANEDSVASSVVL
ncbi:hypothetical protein [Candidatus Ichthyocystis hellenicum]|uniref:hypothetical protein n=1 Tax=Candidatus Ichthyocystis hellenicum TaxID=1561003 RepID=UPI000A94E430|nr:hypothetical protein [Candidatus Ichthyocystis hellenicum]